MNKIMFYVIEEWPSKGRSAPARVKVYETLVLKLVRKHGRLGKIPNKNYWYLKWHAGLSRREHTRNAYIRKGPGVQSDVIHNIQKRRLQYFGHMVGKSPDRYPQITLYARVYRQSERGNGGLTT